MCGIAGIAGRGDEPLAKAMADCLVHRGPDDAGLYCTDKVTLGHRRLSIIDLETGDQPMSSADGRFWLVFNGEIYNFRDLRKELSARGYVFRTQSDTEVILAAYEIYGEAFVSHLRGMFAFALWDGAEEKLILARDPIGVKPLYYAQCGDTLYFASEMKALLLCPEVDRDLDFEALDDYLTYLHTVPPRTIYRDIRQLRPAHIATWHDGRLCERRYWRLDFDPEARSEAEWREALDACLEETLSKYMISDVPLGAFLSGGLDSGTIVSYMTRQAGTPKTFTVGFGAEGGLYDETTEARTAAKFFGTEHHTLTVAADAAELMPAIVRHFDEPFGNPTALLSYALCKCVREHVTVILSGDGGDECFGGYPRYVGARLAQSYEKVPWFLRRYLVNPLVQCLPESTRGFHGLRRLRAFSAGSLLEPIERYAAWVSYFTHEERQRLYTGDTAKTLGGHDALESVRALARECKSLDPVSQAMYVDVHSFLPNNVLHYGDRMSMAHSLEARVPLADHQLFELLARMPSSLKVRGRQTKYLLRKCMAGRLQAETIRRKKIGFEPPMGVWLNTQLREIVDDFLSEATLGGRGYFNPEYVTGMVRAHRAGRRDYTWQLWSLLVFEQWHRMYLDH